MSLHVGRIGNYKPLNFGGFVECPLSFIADNIDMTSQVLNLLEKDLFYYTHHPKKFLSRVLIATRVFLPLTWS